MIYEKDDLIALDFELQSKEEFDITLREKSEIYMLKISLKQDILRESGGNLLSIFTSGEEQEWAFRTKNLSMTELV